MTKIDTNLIDRRAAVAGILGLSLGSASTSAVAQIKLDLGTLGDIGRMLKGVNLKEQDEIDFGNQLFGALIDTMGGRYRNSSAQSAISKIATTLFETSLREAFGWEVVIVDNNEVNAWALPGGKLGVNKGLLRYVDNEDELAAVIAHEMGHSELSHAAKEMRKKAFYAGLSTAAQAAAISATDKNTRLGTAAGMKSIELPMLRLVASGYSRSLEEEADNHILNVFAKTGYNVARGAGFYETLLELIPRKSKGTTSLFAGHPETQKRLASLRQAGEGVAPAKTHSSGFEFFALKETFPTRKIYKRQ
ncbi:MAG: hypothetical protein DHS20C05_14750 [Hyphococcus sp.]|nr:MAG: hypothetical protein DHS20C05_14750 [Marinicaulis sp.]